MVFGWKVRGRRGQFADEWVAWLVVSAGERTHPRVHQAVERDISAQGTAWDTTDSLCICSGGLLAVDAVLQHGRRHVGVEGDEHGPLPRLYINNKAPFPITRPLLPWVLPRSSVVFLA